MENYKIYISGILREEAKFWYMYLACMMSTPNVKVAAKSTGIPDLDIFAVYTN